MVFDSIKKVFMDLPVIAISVVLLVVIIAFGYVMTGVTTEVGVDQITNTTIQQNIMSVNTEYDTMATKTTDAGNTTIGFIVIAVLMTLLFGFFAYMKKGKVISLSKLPNIVLIIWGVILIILISLWIL